MKKEELKSTKKFHELTTEEKIESSVFFKLGYFISKEVGIVNSYGILDNYYKYQNNAYSVSTPEGRVTTDILWLSPEIAKAMQMPERIEIKSGAVQTKRDVFYKEKHTGNTVFTETYEIMIGEGQNFDALPKILSGFFNGQFDMSKNK